MVEIRKEEPNGAVLYNQNVHSVYIPESTRLSGEASPELLAEAITLLHRDGIIILENAIDKSHLDALEDLLGPEAEEIARDPDHHFNFGKRTRNMDQAPPLIPDLMYQDVWANPAACSILKQILGPDLVCHYANGNTALPNPKISLERGRQPVHSDIDKPHPLYPFAYILNIPLSDVDETNGSTEIWIGSHHGSCMEQHTTFQGGQGLTIKPDILEERRLHSPPVYPTISKGSIVVRDVRLWHAGVPNRSNKPRILLAFVLQPKWFEASSKVLLPIKTRGLIDRWKQETGLEYAAHWVDGEVDHRKVTSDDVDFATSNRRMLELEADGLMRVPPH